MSSSTDPFEATFRVTVDRPTAWRRLTEATLAASASADAPTRLRLPGLDAAATVVESDAPGRLRATKDEEPFAGTDIVVTLTDVDGGTRIHIVQSGFDAGFGAPRHLMEIGWRYIVADLRTHLGTGVAPGRHLRPWGDLGAAATPEDGGLRVDDVRSGGLADRIGLVDGDLLTVLAGAPVTDALELETVLRVIDGGATVTAEWVRAGELHAPRDRP